MTILLVYLHGRRTAATPRLAGLDGRTSAFDPRRTINVTLDRDSREIERLAASNLLIVLLLVTRALGGWGPRAQKEHHVMGSIKHHIIIIHSDRYSMRKFLRYVCAGWNGGWLAV